MTQFFPDRLSDSWNVMYAGDVAFASQIIETARRSLYPYKGKITVETVKLAVCDAYRALVSERIVGEYLSRYGYKSVEEFRGSGLGDFGPELFKEIVAKIDKFDLNVALIVFGFEDMTFEVDPAFRFRHILLVQNPGVSESRNVEGFAAIGSGYAPAIASLSINRGHGFSHLEDTVYLLCEAKFCAEGSSGVGRATNVEVFSPTGKIRKIMEGPVERLRQVWEEKKKYCVPDEAGDILDSIFKDMESTDQA